MLESLFPESLVWKKFLKKWKKNAQHRLTPRQILQGGGLWDLTSIVLLSRLLADGIFFV